MDLAYGHMFRKQLDRGLGIHMSIRCPSSAAQAIHHLIPLPPLARPPAAPNGGFETGISWATEESSTSLLQTYIYIIHIHTYIYIYIHIIYIYVSAIIIVITIIISIGIRHDYNIIQSAVIKYQLG